MSTQDIRGRKSTLLQRYQTKASSQDPLQQPIDATPIAKTTSQRSLQSSSLLQKYYSKTTPQDIRNEPSAHTDSDFAAPRKSSSQRSLDQSKLLQRYYKQNSQDAQDVQDVQKSDPQQYSSQKSLESSKLLQRYNPVNNSQEFTGLAIRESTPVARFMRSGSLDHGKQARSTLLSRYTPRFGKSLDRKKDIGMGAYSGSNSQQSLDQQDPVQSLSESQTFEGYTSDRYDQYDSRNIRSRSSSMARSIARRSLQSELEPSSKKQALDPVTPETLPVLATPEPVMGNIASALPMPMFCVIPPVAQVESTAPTLKAVQKPEQALATPSVIVTTEAGKSDRNQPIKPPRKDLVSSPTVSIPISTIKTSITVVPPTPVTPTKPAVVPVVPKELTPPPLTSNRDRMGHYGSASDPYTPAGEDPNSTTASQPGRNTMLLPISDLSSRHSMSDLRQMKDKQPNQFAMEIDESSERNEMSSFSKKKEAVKTTLASAFDHIAAISVPQASTVLDDDDQIIESIPANRKLKKRDHTYHPTFVPKQAKTEDSEKKRQEEKLKLEMQKKVEQERKKDEEKAKKQADKLHKEAEKSRKEDEKRRKDEEKKLKMEDEKRKEEKERLMKKEEKRLKEEEKKLKEEEKRKKDEEKKKQKEEKKKGTLQKSLSADQEPLTQPEEETIDFGSHLEQYNPSGPEKNQAAFMNRTPRGSQAALHHHTLPAMSSPMYSSQQSLDRSGGIQSKMLQRYAKRSGSQDFTATATTAHSDSVKQEVHRSQGSLTNQRASRSTLLQKYTPRPLSASITANQSAAAATTSPRSTSQVSLDKNRIERSTLLQRYKPSGGSTSDMIVPTETTPQQGADQRMSIIMFPSKKRPEKYSTFDYRDHEYEPIGEPVEALSNAKSTEVSTSLAPAAPETKRKLSSSSLRVTKQEDDSVSMEELQKNIEDRYFNRPSEEETVETAEPVEISQEKTSKMKAVMARAQESSKKAMARAQESSKNAMAKAQEGGKSLHEKLRKQTDRFKTKVSNINVKKDKSVAPLASPEVVTTPEIETFDFTIAEPKAESQSDEVPTSTEVEMEATREEATEEPIAEDTPTKKKSEFSTFKNIHMPKIQKPEFKRPEFTKITKPKMPKLKGPDMSKFKRPEMPKFLTEKPDFSKLKMPEKIGMIKLQRSKSMKEPSPSPATGATPSDIESPSDNGTDGTKKKIDYTNFSTYPRLLDKFKRQKSVPSNASVRASTPPPLEFTKAGRTSRPKGASFISRWADKSSEDTASNRFFSGSELGERETSTERHMRQKLESADLEAPELALTAEQKQLEEYDKENREIHLLSAARHDEFLKRKPPMERQESDLASEEEKQFWASSLGQKIRQNIDMNSNDFDFLDEEDQLRIARENETMGLSERDRARFLGDTAEQSEKDYDLRSTTPYSNKECQSSGSSGIRRRKGVLEEIDDDEFFLRQKGISKDNIQMGEYISTAIKEGLSTPKNALAEMGQYEAYYDEDVDASERTSVDYRGERSAEQLHNYYQPSFESDDLSNKQSFTDEFRKNDDFYKTFPPDRPVRKHNKKSFSTDQYDDEQQKVPYDSYQQEEEDVELYEHERKYTSEQPEGSPEKDERFMDDENVGNGFSRVGTAVPPTPPRRRKKRFRDVTSTDVDQFANGMAPKSIYNSFIVGPETHVFGEEVSLAQEESFTTPLPTPRRSRSRSQISKTFEDDTTSYTFGAEDSVMRKHTIDLTESNGYAIVRKDPPPRPPAPIRRRKSTRSLDEQRPYNTLPNYHSVSPMRPSRNYSTISPNRPPRTRIATEEQQMKSSSVSKEDVTQYEEIEDTETLAQTHQAPVYKMKDRPLPPPPRPPRDHKKPRKPEGDDRHDFDDDAEKIVVTETFEPRVVEEVEIAIQTDPVSEDYELDMEVSDTISGRNAADKSVKTLQEILKEEQQAEIDRARQLAEASNLMRDIQKFRDSTSSLSLHGSRPETPAAVLLERRVSTPSESNIRDRFTSSSMDRRPLSSENLTDQDLAHAEDDNYIAQLVKKYVSDEKVTADTRKQPNFEIEAMKFQEFHKEESKHVQSEPTVPLRRRSLVSPSIDQTRGVEIPSNVIEEIVERLRTSEQQHISELQELHKQQLEELRKQQEEQKTLQEQRLMEQQNQLLNQQNQQLHETQQLREQIQQQQEQQKALLLQQQQQQQQLLLAQQQQQIMLEQQEKERELQRERERELLREREIELEKARERERELHHARELELQRSRKLEQQRARELEEQRMREHELQRALELEHQRLRETELQRAQEAEMQRIREAELKHAREAELQRAIEAEFQRAREAEQRRLKAEELAAQENNTGIQSVETPSEAKNEATVENTESVDVLPETGESVPEAIVAEKASSKEEIPLRPPLPRLGSQVPMAAQYPYHEYLPYSHAPQPLYHARNFSDDEAALPHAPNRRRRHHRSRRESTSEEEFQREQRRHGSHGTRSPEPSIPMLGSQLIRACGSSIRQTGDELMTILRASSKDENKRDLHIALIILIVIVAGLMALGMSGEKAVHHHHWDYFTPPGNSGNA
ncbi:trichohyalin isoform X1 [Toxorhynchites rutilus septentrionalis]|uniref:trichohyalin isoform X1 n=1 Tax=Toxorhynchites rutilus septentrionalis TaxID=329112 RepID=UPI002478C421|nr:trichohyalin isoform X1 [Toxorhynchites rutilus septentrionalis]XP_055631504.1 trichohyalin isoform X1 [Toxorhynchites rutilus septentrionalis]XP_055631505.1 trichohyalin isoform X1 [Toxorhynchites rutilus septentrionalis]XP_055631506.1 trichohyalin isoform X1 [Toxorhynchites rutilus septentrionalis]XP_055631507.1 trichohyalin isoform X1 [Toxorhynchites rutilus septentrionalis]XP_055631508.1 trichohyalin isoform X1 [Toxorhynchites rutilus septentrionalis]